MSITCETINRTLSVRTMRLKKGAVVRWGWNDHAVPSSRLQSTPDTQLHFNSSVVTNNCYTVVHNYDQGGKKTVCPLFLRACGGHTTGRWMQAVKWLCWVWAGASFSSGSRCTSEFWKNPFLAESRQPDCQSEPPECSLDHNHRFDGNPWSETAHDKSNRNAPKGRRCSQSKSSQPSSCNHTIVIVISSLLLLFHPFLGPHLVWGRTEFWQYPVQCEWIQITDELIRGRASII